MIVTPHAAMQAAATEYFRRLDAGGPDLLDLFTDDVVIYFPKFGVGHGKQALIELGTGLAGTIATMSHPANEYQYFSSGDTHLVVEGITHGRDRANRQWSGGKTPGGRFCSVFEFRDGLIARMFIYLDPDYASDDFSRFHWGVDGRTW